MTIEINFGLWLKWGWDKIKKANLSEKKWTTMIMKKIFIYYNDEKNTQTTINNRGVIKKVKNMLKKGRGYYKENKERLQGMARDWSRGISGKEKTRKEFTQKIENKQKLREHNSNQIHGRSQEKFQQ